MILVNNLGIMKKSTLFLFFALALLAWLLLTFFRKESSLDVVIEVARERGYRAAQVQWEQVEAEAKDVASREGEDAAIRYVLEALGDDHSFYLSPADSDAESSKGSTNSGGPPRVLSEPKESADGVPVVQVNGWTGSQNEAMAATAALRSHLVDALARAKCGVLLDFSNNTGGNMWPMLIGLSPLLTEGVLGYFEDAQGAASVIEKSSGAIVINGAPHPFNRATAQLPQRSAQLIAIVIGPRSTSSGEIVPIMFHGQSNVRFFGQPTSGHSTANATFPLPNGGFAYITTATTLDRNRTKFGGKLAPDLISDQPVADAARWIASGCSPQ